MTGCRLEQEWGKNRADATGKRHRRETRERKRTIMEGKSG